MLPSSGNKFDLFSNLLHIALRIRPVHPSRRPPLSSSLQSAVALTMSNAFRWLFPLFLAPALFVVRCFHVAATCHILCTPIDNNLYWNVSLQLLKSPYLNEGGIALVATAAFNFWAQPLVVVKSKSTFRRQNKLYFFNREGILSTLDSVIKKGNIFPEI